MQYIQTNMVIRLRFHITTEKTAALHIIIFTIKLQTINNAGEGWHSWYKKMISTHHASMWKLKDEDMIIQLVGGHKEGRCSIKKHYTISSKDNYIGWAQA